MIIRQHLGKWYEAHSEPYCGGYARKCTDDPHAHASSTRDLDAHHHDLHITLLVQGTQRLAVTEVDSLQDW